MSLHSWLQSCSVKSDPMTHSCRLCIGGVLALLALAPLDCRHAISEKKSSTAEKKTADAPSELRADEVTDVDKDAPPEKNAAPAGATAPEPPEWEIAAERERQRIQRERQTRAKADWKIAIRTDTATIVPCQPMYVTIKVTNATSQARKLDELLESSEIYVLVGRKGAKVPLVDQSRWWQKMIVCFDADEKEVRLVPGFGSVFSDRMLTTPRDDVGRSQNADGSWPPPPKAARVFGKPGEYNVYAAVVDRSSKQYVFEVLRSEPLSVSVREPTESESPYVDFFRDGNQIPPLYGFSEVDEEVFQKLRDLRPPERIERMVAFNRRVYAETIDKLRDMLARHPDPPVADDIRHFLMAKLNWSAKRYDEKGRDLGYDREVLAAAIQHYLEIAPERKQLRRQGIDSWDELSTRFDLDHAQPILQVLASWKASSPFYEDEAESQAALDEIIAKIEARYAQHARARAAAPRPKPKLPTD